MVTFVGAVLLACVGTPAADLAATPAPAPRRAANDPRGSLFVPREEACPKIAAPTGDPKKLAATGTDRALLVDPMGFLRPEIGIPEAVALLGDPVLCNHDKDSSFGEMYLLPRDASVHRLELETESGQLIGIVVELDPPATVDITAVSARFGKPRFVAGPDDSHEAGGYSYDVATKAFTGQIMYSHRRSDDPATAWRVHLLIVRRFRPAKR